jgi:hypothetical protein
LLVYGRYPSLFTIVCQVAAMPYFYKTLGQNPDLRHGTSYTNYSY